MRSINSPIFSIFSSGMSLTDGISFLMQTITFLTGYSFLINSLTSVVSTIFLPSLLILVDVVRVFSSSTAHYSTILTSSSLSTLVSKIYLISFPLFFVVKELTTLLLNWTCFYLLIVLPTSSPWLWTKAFTGIFLSNDLYTLIIFLTISSSVISGLFLSALSPKNSISFVWVLTLNDKLTIFLSVVKMRLTYWWSQKLIL